MKKNFTLILRTTGFLMIALSISTLKAQNVYIPDPVFKSNLVSNPSININMDGNIQVTEAVAFTGTISCVEYGIHDVTGVEQFINLTGLDVGDNYISSMDLSANPLLIYLGCSNNWLTSLDLTNNPLLQQVYCSSNYLTSLDVSGLDSLTDLLCSSNNLTSLDVSGNLHLNYLDCGYNQLTGLILPSSGTVTNLYCPGNQISYIDFSSNTNIANLGLSGNQFTCLDVSMLTNLLSFDCTNNQLQGLNVQNGNNVNLTWFYAYGNPNLYCIQVDDVTYSSGAWSNIDSWAYFGLSCGSAPTVSFNSSAPSCYGTPVVFIDNSWPVNSWLWDFGDGNTSTQQNPLHTFADPGNYTVNLIASNCFGSDTASMVIVQGVDVYGHVSYSGGDVTNGIAIMYPYETYYISFDTIEIANLDPAGNFHFTNIPQGDYLIKVFADTLMYPDLIPTYSYSDWAWDSALVVFHGCVYDDTADVYMLELPAPTTGSGVLHGVVIEGPGFGRAQGDPIHGVDVKLGVTGSSSILANTTTDINGEYAFTNLAFGNYTIYADIPGLERDSSYQITLDAVNSQFLNLDYMVDSNSVYIVQGIGIENYYAPDNSDMTVYPNPVKNDATIRYTLNQDAHLKLEIINIYGVVINTLVNADMNSGEYNYTFNPRSNNLTPGIYFIKLTANGKSRSLRIVVM